MEEETGLFDDLEAFLYWWTDKRCLKPPPDTPIHVENSVTQLVVYREGQYQVQLIQVLPNSEIPDHVHPDVDSFEVYFCGDIVFRKDGKSYYPTNGERILRIKPDTPHGGTFGKHGGCFFSVQKWIGKEPDFISNNWEFADEELSQKNFKL